MFSHLRIGLYKSKAGGSTTCQHTRTRPGKQTLVTAPGAPQGEKQGGFYLNKPFRFCN